MVLVDHRRPRMQLRQVADDGVAVPGAGLLAAFLAHPLAEELGLGDQGQVLGRQP